MDDCVLMVFFKKAFYYCVPHNNKEKLTDFKFYDNDNNFYIINENNNLFICLSIQYQLIINMVMRDCCC